jgi:hypothetical protein
MITRTQIVADRQAIVKYLVKEMRVSSDKMLIIQYNMGNHWILLSISTMYHQVWYCPSNRPTDLDNAEQLTVITLISCSSLTSKFVIHFSF